MENLKMLENRYKILMQQLQIMQLYPEEFVDKMGGIKGFNAQIDIILDEISLIKKIISKK